MNNRKELNDLYEEILKDHNNKLNEVLISLIKIDSTIKEWNTYKLEIRSEINQFRNHYTYNPTRGAKRSPFRVKKNVSFVENKSPNSAG